MAFSAWVWGKLGAKVRELVGEQALSKLEVNVDSMKWFVEQRPVACMEACLPWRDLDRLIVQGMCLPPPFLDLSEQREVLMLGIYYSPRGLYCRLP